MKKHTFTLFALFFFFAFGSELLAQGLNYQAVARNSSGSLLANQSISVRFVIHEGSSTGTAVYEETHSSSTNDYGLFSLVVGKGSTIGGNLFEDIDWMGNDHFLEVEINGTSMGATQLETVPYSKVATAMQVNHLTDVNIGAVAVGDVLTWNGTEWVNQPTNTDTVWSTNGTATFYDKGNVGIGTSTPSDVLEVVSTTAGGVLVSFAKDNASAGNDVLELRTQTGGPDDAAFIEMQRGSTVEARIRTNGAAEFLNVTVEEDLPAATSPVKGRVYANALPVAYGYVNSGTTTASLVTEYGVASITKPASTTGVYQITLNKTLSGSPVIIGTSFNASPNDEIVTANNSSSTQIEINITDGSGTAVNSNFYFVVYGTVQ